MDWVANGLSASFKAVAAPIVPIRCKNMLTKTTKATIPVHAIWFQCRWTGAVEHDQDP